VYPIRGSGVCGPDGRCAWREYEAEDTPEHPLVCFDEKPVVLHAETRPSLPVAPGQPARSDYEYERQGTANLFVMVEPLAGWRHIAVTERRTKQDYARSLQWLVDIAFPRAETIRAGPKII
jgi:hypothetical protein